MRQVVSPFILNFNGEIIFARFKETTMADGTSWAPTAKVSAGVLAGAGTTLLAGLLKTHYPDFMKDPAITGAVTSIFTFIVQYVVPERK